MRSPTPWEALDAIAEQRLSTTFEETAQVEIDRKLALENPDHEDSKEFSIINRERCSELAETMLLLLERITPDRGLCRSSAIATGRQIFVLLWLLQSSKNEIATLSMAEIATKLGCTRALLSFYAKRIEKVFGFHGRGMKGKEASKSFVESAHRGWETRRSRELEDGDLDAYQEHEKERDSDSEI